MGVGGVKTGPELSPPSNSIAPHVDINENSRTLRPSTVTLPLPLSLRHQPISKPQKTKTAHADYPEVLAKLREAGNEEKEAARPWP